MGKQGVDYHWLRPGYQGKDYWRREMQDRCNNGLPTRDSDSGEMVLKFLESASPALEAEGEVDLPGLPLTYFAQAAVEVHRAGSEGQLNSLRTCYREGFARAMQALANGELPTGYSRKSIEDLNNGYIPKALNNPSTEWDVERSQGELQAIIFFNNMVKLAGPDAAKSILDDYRGNEGFHRALYDIGDHVNGYRSDDVPPDPVSLDQARQPVDGKVDDRIPSAGTEEIGMPDQWPQPYDDDQYSDLLAPESGIDPNMTIASNMSVEPNIEGASDAGIDPNMGSTGIDADMNTPDAGSEPDPSIDPSMGMETEMSTEPSMLAETNTATEPDVGDTASDGADFSDS